MDIRERSCTAKRRYSAPAPARAAAVRTADANGGTSHTAYRCPFCQGWHVGRPPSLATLQALADAIRGR